jgi:hypothetical protein
MVTYLRMLPTLNVATRHEMNVSVHMRARWNSRWQERVGSIRNTLMIRVYPRFAPVLLLSVLNLMRLDVQVENGVKLGEGDGTVSLLSLGAMCVEGWKRKRWNPAGIRVTTVEVWSAPLVHGEI